MRLAAVLTDLGYLLAAAFPPLIQWTSRYSAWRYRRLAPAYDQIVDGAGPAYTAPLEAALAEVAGAVRWVADVGAGTGSGTRLVRARFPEAMLVALDLSPSMLRRLCAPRSMRAVATVHALPLRPGTFDLVVVQNAPPNFQEIGRAVRPEGVVIFSLSSGALIPVRLRRWLVRRWPSAGMERPREVVVGEGVSWVVRRRARSSG